MAEVTNELMFETLKAIRSDISELKVGQLELKQEVAAIRGHMVAIQSDISNIYGIAGKLEAKVERVESRLDIIGEPAE
ncbi:MAG: hypothetical protein OXR62_09015 [Ahrensia sp.]|nr:hypothetical protein [Ahrensia sp.]